jgi:energy-coupling factor transport system permease protein
MLFRNISLGVYYPGNSFLHRLQARTKLLMLLSIMLSLVVAGQIYWHFTPYVVGFVLVLLGVFCSGIAWREMGRRLWFLLIIVALTTSLELFAPVGIPGLGIPLYVFPTLALTPGFFAALFAVAVLLIGTYLVLALWPLPALRRAPFQRGLQRARMVTIVLAFTLIFALAYAYFSQPTQATPRLAYMLTNDSVWYGGIFFALFLILYPCSLLLTMTTSPVALIEGLTMLLAPLRWLRLPVDDFALMTLIALRFIPTLMEEIEQLIKAQSARGASVGSGSVRARIQSVQALFVPFMRNTLRRASELATALDARGYQVDGHQTRLHEKAFGLADYLVLVLVIGSMVVAIKI